MSSTMQVLLAIIVSMVAGSAFTAMLFYLLIFPLINKLCKKNLPCYDFSRSAEDWMNGYFHQTMVKIEVEKAISPRKIVPFDEKKPVRFVDVHKDVETVRLPKIVAPQEKDLKLTATKIDIAAKEIIKPSKAKQTATKEAKPTAKNKTEVEAETPQKKTVATTKKAEKNKDVETFELNVPTQAPQMDVKSTQTATKASATKRSPRPLKKDKTVETVEITIPTVTKNDKK